MKAKAATRHPLTAQIDTAAEPAEQRVEWRRNAALIAVGSVVAAACGYAAFRTVASRRGSAHRNGEWKAEDAKLDLKLEQAGNTSEPTAVY